MNCHLYVAFLFWLYKWEWNFYSNIIKVSLNSQETLANLSFKSIDKTKNKSLRSRVC